MEWLVVLVAVSLMVGAFAQSVTGLGFSLIAAPAMLALLGPRDGVVMIVVLAALASLIPLTHQWRHIGFRDAGSLLLPTLLATPVVVAALAGVDTAVVAVGAGIAVLIGVFLLAHGATQERFGAGPLARYDADLVVPEPTLAEVAVLKAITYVHVMSGNDSRYVWERQIINDVVDGLLSQRRRLQPPFQQVWDATDDPAVRLRVVIDQVASLTDLSIMRWHRDLA